MNSKNKIYILERFENFGTSEDKDVYLMGRALTIWATPVTEYKPDEKQLDTYALVDEGELTGRLIAKFTFKNTSTQSKLSVLSRLLKLYDVDPGDDIKSFKVFIQLSNVSIENETDWLQMANFHAGWTKNFYDVIVPYIKQ